ncbi:MAG: hypothetical protein V9H26_26870 [Verrucomicrobiota bacterium]
MTHQGGSQVVLTHHGLRLMTLIDFILNLAALLLWFNWRAARIDPLATATPSTLAGTLRRAGKTTFAGWHLPAAISVLIFVRGIFYWLIGTAVPWTGTLDVGVISVPFRSDLFGRMLLYSMLSFAMALTVFFIWLILLSSLMPATAEVAPLRGLLRSQLGRVERWPWGIKLLLPFLLVTTAWWLVSWPLTYAEILPRPGSVAQRTEQALLVGLGSYLAGKVLIGGALGLYLVSSYIYFGRHPFWQQLDEVSRRLLVPLRRLPLRLGKVDFAPVLGIGLAFLLAHMVENGIRTSPRKDATGRPQARLLEIPGLVELYQRVAK